ncbi:hypothetical protein F2P81_006220 [Scophthalmus maximus]|uniref:Uncharacterized protein n=1 Tax=Scophthalmus maximus TaxID=52904 RepID=A0A6A4TDM2_SCOMX|nr:hypothetical protein F2P81_006220 [Scophthalmus maximus]
MLQSTSLLTWVVTRTDTTLPSRSKHSENATGHKMEAICEVGYVAKQLSRVFTVTQMPAGSDSDADRYVLFRWKMLSDGSVYRFRGANYLIIILIISLFS